MLYTRQDPTENANDNQYPPLLMHDGYSNPYFTSNASSTQHAYPPTHLDGRRSFYYPPHDYEATVCPSKLSHDLSESDFGPLDPTLSQIIPIPSLLSSATEALAFLSSSDCTIPSADATYPNSNSYEAEPRRKRPRGTTGIIVCDGCDKKFTVASSMYRHKRTRCHGRKSRRTTWTFGCDGCGRKFKLATSMHRHKRTSCHGKKSNRESPTTRCGIIKAQDARLVTGYNEACASPIRSISNPAEDGSQVGRLQLNSLNLAAANTTSYSLDAENANFTLDPAAITSSNQQPNSTKYYIPMPLDNSADHRTFFCDHCYATFQRRDILQMHKAETHNLTEIGYLPVGGAINLPPYLIGVTSNTKSRH